MACSKICRYDMYTMTSLLQVWSKGHQIYQLDVKRLTKQGTDHIILVHFIALLDSDGQKVAEKAKTD